MVRPGRDRLAGAVEVDEVYIGGERLGKRGRGAAGKALVLVVAQAEGNQTGRIRLVRSANASAGVLRSALEEVVEPGAQVLTDGWDGYGTLAAAGFRHQVVRAAAVVGENLLPRANRVASLLQRWLLGTHQGGWRTRTWITTWMSSPSGSTVGDRASAGCCFTGWSSKRCRLARFVAANWSVAPPPRVWG